MNKVEQVVGVVFFVKWAQEWWGKGARRKGGAMGEGISESRGMERGRLRSDRRATLTSSTWRVMQVWGRCGFFFRSPP